MLTHILARARDWLDSLAVQTMLVVMLGIGAMHVASLWTYQRALVAEAELANEARLADRLLAIKRSVMRADPQSARRWRMTCRAAPSRPTGAGRSSRWRGRRRSETGRASASTS